MSISAALRVSTGSGRRYRGSGVSSSFTQGSIPMARALRARRTASSAVRAPEVLGKIRYFCGSSTDKMLSAWGWERSTLLKATVTISAWELCSAALRAAAEGNLPVPTIRRERKERPAIIRGSWDINISNLYGRIKISHAKTPRRKAGEEPASLLTAHCLLLTLAAQGAVRLFSPRHITETALERVIG